MTTPAVQTVTSSIRRALGAALLPIGLSLALVAPLAAQGARTVEVARQLGADSEPLQVLVTHDVGRVAVRGADRGLLYQLQLAYDPRRAQPVYGFDSAGRHLHVGLRKGAEATRDRSTLPELRLDLARTVPIDLRIEMGAAEADLDLGGMRLRRLGVESGASEAVLHFDTPNTVDMQLLSIDVGAASLRARGLGNSRAREMRVSVGIGSADLDFGGEWVGDMNLDLQVALGSARLRVPEEVGVRVDVRRFLASFEREGFVKRGDGWYSANWDTARRKLHVRARTVLGELEIGRGAN